MKETQHDVDANDFKIADDKRKAEEIRQKSQERLLRSRNENVLVQMMMKLSLVAKNLGVKVLIR